MAGSGGGMSAPIRVGAVSYLNAKPLYYRLDGVRCPACAWRWTCPAGWPTGWRRASSTWR